MRFAQLGRSCQPAIFMVSQQPSQRNPSPVLVESLALPSQEQPKEAQLV